MNHLRLDQNHVVRHAPDKDGLLWRSQSRWLGCKPVPKWNSGCARAQIAAADGRLFAIWQREGAFPGAPLPADRLGFNRSIDGGITWLGPALLPGNTGVNRNHQQVWMVTGGALHLAWCHGNPGNPSSPTGYMFSPDYGATWFEPEIAISTPGGNLPHGIVADHDWVHIIAEPGAGTYARRRVPAVVQASISIRKEGSQLLLEWTGQGTLQAADDLGGPWKNISDVKSPYSLSPDRQTRFFRSVIR